MNRWDLFADSTGHRLLFYTATMSFRRNETQKYNPFSCCSSRFCDVTKGATSYNQDGSSSSTDRKPTVTATQGGRRVSLVTEYLPPAETVTFGLDSVSAARFLRRLQR